MLWTKRAAIGAVVLGVCTASITSACSSSSSGSSGSGNGSGSKSSITVGLNDSLTGANISSGTSDLQLARAAVAYANATGGIDGHNLVLRVLNSGDVGSG